MTTPTDTQCTLQFPDLYDPRAEGKESDPNNQRRQRMYSAVRALLKSSFDWDKSLPTKARDFAVTQLATKDRSYFVGVYGVLALDGFNDPACGGDHTMPAHGDIEVPPPDQREPPLPFGDGLTFVRVVQRFQVAFVNAVNEYVTHRPLYEKVYPLVEALSRYDANGNGNGDGDNTIRRFEASHLAGVVRTLVEQEVPHDSPNLSLFAQEAFSMLLGGRVEGRAASIQIDLPSLDEDRTDNIIADNVIALSALYYCAQLEEMKLFQVADRVTQDFVRGGITISRQHGQNLYDHYRKAIHRFTEEERRSLYGRAFGLAMGSVDEPRPNREFTTLWMGFLSAVNVYQRQASVEYQYQRITLETVAKAANDLTVNLSLHGYGIGYFAAVELQSLVREVLTMLGAPAVMSAYGATTVWQLVERVSDLYLGGAANGVRHRTTAVSGQKIIEWLGHHAKQLGPGRFATISEPDRAALFNHVSRWLAVSGVQQDTIEKYAEPIATVSSPTIPAWSFQGTPSVEEAMTQLDNIMPETTN
ncbi:hypothetical protein [Haliangium sp.]|uniref:hypothetical protein n=1 Tax=Haliangium sp. TaxID=2663208 RepID=UPI003D0CE088